MPVAIAERAVEVTNVETTSAAIGVTTSVAADVPVDQVLAAPVAHQAVVRVNEANAHVALNNVE